MPDWPNEELLTVMEVAATLRVHQQTVRNWIDAGSLPALRLGRRVRVLRSDLQALIDGSVLRPDKDHPEAVEAEHTAQAFWDGERFNPL